MSENRELEIQETQHALLVAWGRFAQASGLVELLERIHIPQKRYRYAPITKVIEFLVAILAGLPHLQDISRRPIPWTKTRKWPRLGVRTGGPITPASAVLSRP